MHQSALSVRMNSWPSLGTMEELPGSRNEFMETSSNFGLALNTKQSPPCVMV